MTTSTAQDQINDWVSSTYGVTPATTSSSTPTDGSGMLAAASTPATSATSATSATGAAPVDINSWYRSTLGRDGDAAGISFWQQALDSGRDAQSLYSDFQKAATANNEDVKANTTWAAANNYNGPQSSDKSTIVDDWGKNVLGRALTGSEQVKWSTAMANAATPAQAHQVYQDFLASMGGQVKNNLSFADASQINATSNPYAPTLIDNSQLAHRTIDPATETVAGHIRSLLAEDSPVLQQARQGALTTMNERGLLNSALADSAAQDAMIKSATGIATTDSGYYNDASNYNAAVDNQATMYNTQAQNAATLQSQSLNASAAQQAASLDAAAAQQTASLASQKSIAQLQADTSKYSTEINSSTSKYNTDTTTRQQTDSEIRTLSNNIINNMDLSPDRKAAMLEALGQGTSAKRNADGSVTPGTGLAGAVYIIDSTTADLTSAATAAASYNP